MVQNINIEMTNQWNGEESDNNQRNEWINLENQ
jgi:hypothetical protein